ncbi:MAG TPA: Hsp20/alpha crystallin family protein [Planctomycetota bacterium]|nr:Hsp20/alpha crystallin family protein [Planctomycetota bacterium]
MILNDLAFAGWDQFRDLERVLDEFNRAVGRGRGFATGGDPAVNVWANDDAVVVTTELPGLDPASIAISVVGDTVTISGQRPDESREGATWLRRERAPYEFSRSVSLPFAVDPDRAEARYAKGRLYLALRRPEEQKPKKIAVKAA